MSERYWRAYLEPVREDIITGWALRLDENEKRLRAAEEFVKSEYGAKHLLVSDSFYGQSIDGAAWHIDDKPPKGWVKTRKQNHRDLVTCYPSSSTGRAIRDALATFRPFDAKTLFSNGGINLDPVRHFKLLTAGAEIFDLTQPVRRLLLSLPLALEENLPDFEGRYRELTEREFNLAIETHNKLVREAKKTEVSL